MNPKNTLFVHGLWFNPKGPLAEKIGQHTTILDVLGMKTIGERVQALVECLEANPQITNLVGHSAGCYVIATAIKNGLCRSAKTIVLLNSAPMPGIKFSPFDAVFWALSKPGYLWKLFRGQDIKLSRSDTKKLLSLTDKDLENLGDSLVAESGAFTRHIVLNQFARPWSCIHPHPGTRIIMVNTTDDQMVGGTWVKTEKVFDAVSVHHSTGGHMAALMFFQDTVTEALYGPLD